MFDYLKLEELAADAENIANLISCMYEGMFNGPNSADNFGKAMYLLDDIMRAYAKEMGDYFKEEHAKAKKSA